MKFGIYTDLHFGSYADDDNFLDYQLKVLADIHKDYEKQGIKKIVIGGDVFDSRKKIDVKVLNKVKEFYTTESEKFHIYIIAGNHDYYNKFDDSYSSVRGVFKDNDNIDVMEGMYSMNFDGLKVLLCGWIFDHEKFKKEFSKYHGNLIIGHFEMKDFEMVKGHIINHGMDRKLLKNYEMVLSWTLSHMHRLTGQYNLSWYSLPTRLERLECKKILLYI